MLRGHASTERDKREPTAYNIFMKEEIARIKAAGNTVAHQQAFKQAAANWQAKKATI